MSQNSPIFVFQKKIKLFDLLFLKLVVLLLSVLEGNLDSLDILNSNK